MGIRSLFAARSIAAAFLLWYAGTFAGEVSAQTYPTRPITIMLSYAAGGPTDFLARTLNVLFCGGPR